MEPVVPDHAQQHRPHRLRGGGTGNGGIAQQVGDAEGLQVQVGGCGDRAPRTPHLLQRWRAGRLAVPHQRVQPRDDPSLALALQPVTLFLVREVTDHPAQAVHRLQATASLLIIDAGKGADELGASEAQLVDEGVSHRCRILRSPSAFGRDGAWRVIGLEQSGPITANCAPYWEPGTYAVTRKNRGSWFL